MSVRAGNGARAAVSAHIRKGIAYGVSEVAVLSGVRQGRRAARDAPCAGGYRLLTALSCAAVPSFPKSTIHAHKPWFGRVFEWPATSCRLYSGK